MPKLFDGWKRRLETPLGAGICPVRAEAYCGDASARLIK